jgi:hypothetical protein
MKFLRMKRTLSLLTTLPRALLDALYPCLSRADPFARRRAQGV